MNLEREITDKVGDGGIEALSEQERSRIPSDIDRDDETYRQRIKMVFEHHPKREEANFEHFRAVYEGILADRRQAERASALGGDRRRIVRRRYERYIEAQLSDVIQKLERLRALGA